MTTVIDRAKNLGLRLRARALRYVRNRRGNVAAIIAIGLVPLAGVMGLAAEGSNWLLHQRGQQNAADAAVVAAANMALNDYYNSCASSTCSWGTNYPTEGKSVAKQYGYLDGDGNVTVSVTQVSCPANVSISIGGASCFQATVNNDYPLLLTHLLGFNGNVTVGGVGMQKISASAIAGPVTEPNDICLLALGWSGKFTGNNFALDFHGSSKVNLAGCPVGSNGGMFCSGNSSLNSPYGVAGDGSTDKNSTCGYLNYSQAASIADPYVSKDTSIPANTCSSYAGQSISQPLSSTGTTTTPTTTIVCGNLTLSSNVTITDNEVIVIENGVLDLNGNNLITSGTGGVAIIFTSPTTSGIPSSVTSGSVGYIQDSAGGGGIDIASNPAGSGTWAGITVYQNPIPWNSCNCSALTGTENSYTSTWDGNSSKMGWSLSGAYYLPNANMTLNGATDKASNGYNCFDMVINSITSNGGNAFSMFANPLSQCGQQGTQTPHVLGFRYALVG